jgi:hypothetical protein
MAPVFIVLVFVAWLGGWFTNWRAGAMNLGEVIRLAE